MVAFSIIVKTFTQIKKGRSIIGIISEQKNEKSNLQNRSIKKIYSF